MRNIDTRTVAGLSWLKTWARHQLTAHKKVRKYRPHEKAFEAQEAELLNALLDLERAAGRLLQLTHSKPRVG